MSLANIVVVNYVALEGFQYLSQDNEKNPESLQISMTGFDELSRIYYIGLIAAICSILQIQNLYHSLIKRLVDKINDLQQSLDIKDTYNASMIHELRNPLNAILGAIGLLKYSKSISKEDHETLNIANMSGEILITLINNALDGAKIEANKLELDSHKSDIVEALTKSASLFQWKSREKHVSLSLKIGKKIPDLLEIDEARITQILVNIIGNAVKFTPENGNIKVRARFIPDEIYKSNVDIRPIKTSSSFIEEEEFEERFFVNKELKEDMGQVSEEIIENENRMRRKQSSMTHHDYDADSYTDKSQGPQTNIVMINNPPIHVNIKNNSFTSLCNVESIDERKFRSKTNLSGREIDFRNSFHEWSNFQNGNTNPIVTQPFRNTMQTIIQHDSLEKQPLNFFNQSQKFNINKKNSNDILGDDSNMLAFDSKQNKRQNLTNSSSSNNFLIKKKGQGKSKFYQPNETDEQDDFSEDMGHDTNHEASNNILHSEQQLTLNLKSIENEDNYDHEITQAKGFLIIEVIDSGIGISEEGIKKLFQPFQQADKSIQAKYGGTGLGLWITNKLVALMRGKVEVRSELNKGTTFEIKIPVTGEFNRNMHSNRQNIMLRDLHQSSCSGTPRRLQSQKNKDIVNQNSQKQNNSNLINVLLLQDDEIMSNLFKKYLQKQELQFKYSKSFKDLHRSFRLNKYGAIFIDIDVNVTLENLESLARDIEKNKSKVLQKNNMKCIKKPIQAYQISKILRRIKNQNQEIKKQMPVQHGQLELLRNLQDQNKTPSMKRFSGQRLESQDTRNRCGSSIFLQDVYTAQKQNDFSESDQRIQSDTPDQSTPNTCFNQQQEDQNNRVIEKYMNNQNNVDVNRDMSFKQYSQIQRKTNSGGDANMNSSSSQSSSTQNYQLNNGIILPRQNNQIKIIKIAEKQNGQSTPEGGSPRIMKSGNIIPFQKVKSKLINPNVETNVLAQSSKLQESPLHSNKSTFRMNYPNNSDEEEKKSTNFQIQTPNFNNLSLRSQSNVQSSEMNSAKKIYEQNNSSQDENGSSGRMRFKQKNGIQRNNCQQINTFGTNQSVSNDKDEQIQNAQQKKQPNKYRKSFHSNLVNVRDLRLDDQDDAEDNQYMNMNTLRRQNQEQQAFNRTMPSGAVAAAQVSSIDLQKIKSREYEQKGSKSIGRRVEIEFSESIADQNLESNQLSQAVMVVDDNKMNQFIVQKMLEKVPEIAKKKVEIIVADNGKEAFDKYVENFKDGKIKLILMDCEMPILDGYEASKKIREIENSSQNSENMQDQQKTLIIGLSGNSGEQHSRKCKQAGMNDAITKPIVFDQLSIIIQKALDPKMSKQFSSNGNRKLTTLQSNRSNMDRFNS
eukprot:403370391